MKKVTRREINTGAAYVGYLPKEKIRELLRSAGFNAILEQGAKEVSRIPIPPKHLIPEFQLIEGDAWPAQLLHNDLYIKQVHSLDVGLTLSKFVSPWLYLLDLLTDLRNSPEMIYSFEREQKIVETLYRSWFLVGFISSIDIIDDMYGTLANNLRELYLIYGKNTSWSALVGLVFPHFWGMSTTTTVENACAAAVYICRGQRYGQMVRGRLDGQMHGVLTYNLNILTHKYHFLSRDEVCARVRKHLIEILRTDK